MEVDWQGLVISVSPAAQLSVVHQATQARLIDDLHLGFSGAGWRVAEVRGGPDELEITWSNSNGARGVVSHLFDDTWRIRARITTPGPQPVAPTLELKTPWPQLRLCSGRDSFVVIAAPAQSVVGPAGERLLVARQRSGWVDGSLESGALLLDRPSVAGWHAVSWNLEWCHDERTLGSGLPNWWPERFHLRQDEELRLELPDAGVSVVGAQVATADAASVITAEPGCYTVRVYAGVDTTLLRVSWAESLERVLHSRAAAILERTDASSATPIEAFLLGRAAAAGVIAERVAIEFLAAQVRGTAASHRTPELFEVVGLVDLFSRNGAPELLRLARQRLEQLPAQVGSNRAWLGVALAAQLAAATAPAVGAGAGSVAAGPMEQALLGLERAIVTRDVASVRRVAGLLGGGLPVQVPDDLTIAQLCLLLSPVTEWDELSTGWLQSLGQIIEQQRLRLLAGPVTDEILAWLIW